MSRAVASKDVDAKEVATSSEIQRLLEEDTTPWYKKRNLRTMYLFLVPSAMGVEMTSGYDGEYYSPATKLGIDIGRLRLERPASSQ